MNKRLTTSRRFLAALLALAIAMPGCSRDPQASLEEAVQQRDGRRVEALLNRGADAFSPRGDRPSIFEEAVFATLEDNMMHGIDSPPNPAYQALCRKWRSRYPAVDATLTVSVGLAFLGLGPGGAELMPAISTTYNGSRVTVELAHDETEFHKITTVEDGYIIKLPSGPYRIKGRLVDDTIEAESLEFLGSAEEMEAAMTIPLSRFLRSTVKAHDTYMEKRISSKSNGPSDSGEPQAPTQ